MTKLSQLAEVPNEARVIDVGMGVWVRVRRLPNPDYDAFLSKRLKTARNYETEDEDNSEIAKEAVAFTVIEAWGGIEDDDKDDGSELPFTPAKAFELFKDPQYYRFWRIVRDGAAQFDSLLSTEEERRLGNS